MSEGTDEWVVQGYAQTVGGWGVVAGPYDTKEEAEEAAVYMASHAGQHIPFRVAKRGKGGSP